MNNSVGGHNISINDNSLVWFGAGGVSLHPLAQVVSAAAQAVQLSGELFTSLQCFVAVPADGLGKKWLRNNMSLQDGSKGGDVSEEGFHSSSWQLCKGIISRSKHSQTICGAAVSTTVRPSVVLTASARPAAPTAAKRVPNLPSAVRTAAMLSPLATVGMTFSTT